MDIKLIALDLDDTLLTPDLRISDRNREALLGAAQKGVVVVLATGRMYRSALVYAKDLGIEDLIILGYNGALVRAVRDEKDWDASPVPIEVARRVMTRLMDNDIVMNVYYNDCLFQREETPEGREYARISGVEPIIVRKDLREFLAGPPHKILGMTRPEVLDRIQPELEEEFNGEVYFTRSKPGFLEVLQSGLSKGAALERLSNRLSLGREKVMAIGDALNDVEMLQWAGIGVAVANAHPKALAAANVIAPDHREDGVAWAIKHYVLGEKRT
jgi:Cof subfamily protein (haloacid dehalogenase superfamily)